MYLVLVPIVLALIVQLIYLQPLVLYFYALLIYSDDIRKGDGVMYDYFLVL